MTVAEVQTLRKAGNVSSQIIYEAKQLRLCLRFLWVAVHAPPGSSCLADVRAVHEQGTSEAESVGQGHCHGGNEADAGSPRLGTRLRLARPGEVGACEGGGHLGRNTLS